MHIILTVCFTLFAACIVARSVVPDHENASELYKEFKQTYRKNYANDDDEKRFAIFRDNLKRAQKYQDSDQGTAKYGVTQFSDLTPEEFRTHYANAIFDRNIKHTDTSILGIPTPAPEKYDWRKHGAVGSVLNQGDCGSCWAFSVIGNIEGQWFKKTGKLLSLSQQQLVDCDKEDDGCSGGYPPTTYDVIKTFGGLELASDYPYKAIDQTCKMDKEIFKVYINGSLILPTDESAQTAWLVQLGPIASALNANPLQFYHDGIIHLPPDDCPIDGMNHAVLTVGYGVERGKPFWIVKNSWAKSFGEQGYFRMYRGDGTCGINLVCSTALIY